MNTTLTRRPSSLALAARTAVIASTLATPCAALAQAPTFPDENALGALFSYVRQVRLADIDGDADLDVFTTDFQSSLYRWYENDAQDPPSFTERSFNAGSPAIEVAHADFDADGHLDFVLSFPNADRITWYENDGAAPPTFTPHDVALALHDYPWTLGVADVNADTHIDILANYNSDGLTVWYENDGADPVPGFTERTIDPLGGNVRGLAPADIDADGDTDVFFSGFNVFDGGTGPFDDIDGVGWYENLGGDPPTWTKHEIDTDPTFQTGHFRVVAHDVTGDGLPDALCTLYSSDTIAYFENPNASRVTWTRRDISAGLLEWCYDLALADIDNDGDTDVISQGRLNDTLAWFERGPGSPPTWTPHVLPTTLVRPETVAAGDLTGDGFPDILAGWVTSQAVSWHPAVPPPTCVGDLDGDNDTDVFDFGLFAANFGATGLPPGTGGDLDGDTDVDVFDFGIFAADFGCAP